MNTNPDEETLALWLDDELTGESLAAVESWAIHQPDQLAARDEIRNWRSLLARTIPSLEEPPYPDFFNSRIQQAIRETSLKVTRKPSYWNAWFMPLAACAGMALSFWIGTQSNTPKMEYDVAGAPKAIPVEPIVYTPEKGVEAEWFASSNASATVIVLNGVAAIPDTTDFSETVYLPTDRDFDATAESSSNQEVEIVR